MSDPSSQRLLTVDLLAQLDQRLEEIRAPVTRVWRPGLDDEQMDALTAEIGLSLSTEARAWWAWHDGIERNISVPLPGVGPGWEPLSLSEAVQDAMRKRLMAADWARDFPDEPRGAWPDSWIAFCGTPSPERLACDCAVSAGCAITRPVLRPRGQRRPAPSQGAVDGRGRPRLA
jgi:hypothetical protein